MKVTIIQFANVFIAFFICILWFTGIETFSGGICNYWRCVDMRIMLIPFALIVFLIINLMSIYEPYKRR